MNLTGLLDRCKMEIPNLNQAGVGDDYLTTLLNQGCDQVNLYAQVYSGYTDFDALAEIKTYSLSSNVPLYLGTDKRGLFFKDSDDKWQDVIPKTEAWLRAKYPDYLNSDSTSIPTWYWIDGDTLGLHPTPDTAKTDGIRLYHLKRATAMATGDSFPWAGSGVEITALLPLDDALIQYVRWNISPAFGQVTDQDIRRREFIQECQRGAMQIKRRKDLSHDSDYRIHV